MISFSSLSKRRGATLAGVFSLAFSCVLLLCGAGSVPIENLLPQGAMQGDLNAGGHSLTNAATVSATNVVVSGTLTAPSSFTLSFSQLTSTPSTLAGYGITDGVPNTATVNGHALSGNVTVTPSDLSLVIGTNTEAWSSILDAAAAGTYLIAGTNITLTPSGNTITINAAGTSLTVGTNLAGAGVTIASDVLDAASGFNGQGQLARLIASDGTADGTIALLGTTDDGYGSVAIGQGTSALYGGFAGGKNAIVNGGGGAAVGLNTTANDGGAVGDGAADLGFGGGGAVGYGATVAASGGAVGLLASATSGFAGGANTTETGGGANFCGGTYAGTGIAIAADEIAVPNGSGFATLTACINSSAPASSSATGVAGQFAYDANYFYVCVATNTWERIALSSF